MLITYIIVIYMIDMFLLSGDAQCFLFYFVLFRYNICISMSVFVIHITRELIVNMYNGYISKLYSSFTFFYFLHNFTFMRRPCQKVFCVFFFYLILYFISFFFQNEKCLYFLSLLFLHCIYIFKIS